MAASRGKRCRVDPFVQFAKWTSLGLMMDDRRHGMAFDKDSLRKASLKTQIKTVLKAFEWIPGELSYQDTKLLISRDQIKKYGKIVHAFISEYNDKVRSMMLPPKLMMPQNYNFYDILISHVVSIRQPKLSSLCRQDGALDGR